jgi:hypothetical protein
VHDLRSAARTLGLDLHVLHASSDDDFEKSFAAMADLRVGGLVIGTDGFLINRSEGSRHWRCATRCRRFFNIAHLLPPAAS